MWINVRMAIDDPNRIASPTVQVLGSLMNLSPRDNLVGFVDDRVVVEHERGNLVIASQALDRAAATEKAIGSIAAIGSYDFRSVTGRNERPVGPGARMPGGGAERAVANVELHRWS